MVLYHRTAIDAAEDFLLEIVDYAYRKVAKLVSGKIKWVDAPTTAKDLQSETKEAYFERNLATIDFKIACSCISILQYLSDQVKHLSPAVLRHLHLENDTLMALVVLIEERPWLRKRPSDGAREKFEDSNWIEVKQGEKSKIPKLEAQVWITLHTLLLAPECAKNYEITDYRKNMLLRVEVSFM